MKKLLLLVVVCLFSEIPVFLQVKVKPLDPEMMKGKVLYIHDFNPDDPKIQRWIRKEKTNNVKSAQYIADKWKDVMQRSSWNATPYELKKFKDRDLISSRDINALILQLTTETLYCGGGVQNHNHYAKILMTGPRQRIIASALINDLHVYMENDLCLIMNMLSHSLNEAMEAYSDENLSNRKKIKLGYQEDVVDFMDHINDKTFLVIRLAMREEVFQRIVNSGKYKKSTIKRWKQERKQNLAKDKAVEDILKGAWTLCDIRMVYKDKLDELRAKNDDKYFYWLNIQKANCSPIKIGTNHNHLFSCDGDKVLFAFKGKGKMKPSTVKDVQKNMIKQYDKYKKEIAD